MQKRLLQKSEGNFSEQALRAQRLKIQDCPPGCKFSSEIEKSKRAAHQTPTFCGEF